MKQLFQHKTKLNNGVEGLLKRKMYILIHFLKKKSESNSRVVARALLGRC